MSTFNSKGLNSRILTRFLHVPRFIGKEFTIRDRQRRTIERVHQEKHSSLYQYDYTVPLDCNHEDVTPQILREIMSFANAVPVLFEPDKHLLWTKFKLSLPDKVSSHNLDKPSIAGYNQVISLLNPIGGYDTRFTKFESSEFQKVLEEFEFDLANLDEADWFPRHTLMTTQKTNEASQSRAFGVIAQDIVRLMQDMKIMVNLEEQVVTGGATNVEEFNQALGIKPDFLFTGEVHEHQLIIPAEMKANINLFVEEIESSGRISEESSLGLLEQCFSYALQTTSDITILSDYYKTIIIEIDFEKTLQKDEKGDDFMNELHFNYVVLKNEDKGLTLRKALLWALYRTFKTQKLENIQTTRTKWNLLAKKMKRSPSKTMEQEKKVSQRFRKELEKFGEVTELSSENLELETIEKEEDYTIGTMPFKKYKYYFDKDAKDDGGIEKVRIKIWNPQGAMSNHPAVADDEFEEQNLCFKTQFFHNLIVQEANALLKIDAYNKNQSNDLMKVNAPGFLKSGSCVIYDKFGLIKHIGLYIATSNVQMTREFEQKDVKDLENQVNLLNSQIGLQHGDLSLENVFVNKDQVYLTGFEKSRNLKTGCISEIDQTLVSSISNDVETKRV